MEIKMNLENSVCLITGSNVRVGRAIALNLSRKGAFVTIHYNSQKSKADDTAELIRSTGKECLIVKGDISKKTDWHQILQTIVAKWKKIDVLVNNAAIFYRTPFFEVGDLDWYNFLDVNLKGTFYGCQIIGEFMVKQRSGKIINIADVSAETVWPSYIPYCISKAGIIALTKGLSKALAPYVTVNAVSPGTVMLAEKYDPAEENYLIERTPLKRLGDPQDIANTVAFLIEGSDFITGTIINVDGGRSLT
jgi:NAD(P)-dependent dehydrogenase (short-subunit alcohol dehydrogenase family)